MSKSGTDAKAAEKAREAYFQGRVSADAYVSQALNCGNGGHVLKKIDRKLGRLLNHSRR